MLHIVRCIQAVCWAEGVMVGFIFRNCWRWELAHQDVSAFVLLEHYAHFDPLSCRSLRELGLDREEGYVGRGTSSVSNE